MVGEARLPGPDPAVPAADQAGHRRGVVRRAERRHAHEPATGRQDAGDRVDARHLERRLVAEQRQDPRQPPGEHRLAGPGRAGEQQVVSARGRDLERAPRTLLAAHVGEVGYVGERLEVVGRRRQLGRPALAAQVRDRLGEVAHPHRLDAGERHLRPGLGGAEQARKAGAARALGGDERARDRPQAPVEGELAERRVAVERVAAAAVPTRRAARARSAGRSRSPPCAAAAGARLIVMRPAAGHSSSAEVMPLRTRSFASWQALVRRGRRSRTPGAHAGCAPRPRRGAARCRRVRG